MVSNFKFDFRGTDPDHRLRVQAIIEKTVSEARAKINKKMFAKHLSNSQLEPKLITDSKQAKKMHQEAVRKAFYVRRDELILKETKFDIEAEQKYQVKCHYKFESNAGKYIEGP